MANILEHINLDKLNSITKYPSIMTYHAIGDRCILSEETNGPIPEEDFVYISEKIDGSNTRIVVYKNDYIIGTRETLLYAKGDRILNADPIKSLMISTVLPYAEKLSSNQDTKSNDIVVYYGETYGHKIRGDRKIEKHYTTNASLGFRIFDISSMPLKEMNKLAKMDGDYIAGWREDVSRTDFLNFRQLDSIASEYDVPLVPYIDTTNSLPLGIEDTYEFLKRFSVSNAALDEGADRQSEGIVVRNTNRTYIRKLRFEDYERTLRKMKEGK